MQGNGTVVGSTGSRHGSSSRGHEEENAQIERGERHAGHGQKESRILQGVVRTYREVIVKAEMSNSSDMQSIVGGRG